jgi:hypothetical protein
MSHPNPQSSELVPYPFAHNTAPLELLSLAMKMLRLAVLVLVSVVDL